MSTTCIKLIIFIDIHQQLFIQDRVTSKRTIVFIKNLSYTYANGLRGNLIKIIYLQLELIQIGLFLNIAILLLILCLNIIGRLGSFSSLWKMVILFKIAKCAQIEMENVNFFMQYVCTLRLILMQWCSKQAKRLYAQLPCFFKHIQ